MFASILRYSRRSISGGRLQQCCPLSTMNVEQQKAQRILMENSFTSDEAERLVRSIDPYLKSASQIDSSLSFWRKLQRAEFSSGNSQKADFERNFKSVFLTKEPRMMFLDEAFLHERIDQLKSLDLISGSKDLWKLFITSPAGYFMQDWSELLRKYYYITYKVLPWIEPDARNKTTNPLMKSPEVIELSYNTIKTRFVFAQRSGFKEVVGSNAHKNILTLKNLMLTSPRDYLSMFAPNCSLEELNALEKLHANGGEQGAEDDKLFQELVDLAPKQNRKDFLNKNLTETYVISDFK